MAGNPADIGGTPENILVLQIKYRFMGEAGINQIATGGVQHALGFAGRTGGVKNKQRIFGIHTCSFAKLGLRIHHGTKPAITRHLHCHHAASVLDDQHGFHARGSRFFQGEIDIVFEWNFFAAADTLISGNN